MAHHHHLVARPPIHIPSFSKWDPNRKDELFLYSLNGNSTNDTTNDNNSTRRENYKYKLTIIDHPSLTSSIQRTKPLPISSKRKSNNTVTTNSIPPPPSSSVPSLLSFTYVNAVFIIPAGRETEYIFSNISGLRSILQSANTTRLIALSFGRNYSMNTSTTITNNTITTTATNINNISIEMIQDELRYVIQKIVGALPEELIYNTIQIKQGTPNPSITYCPFLALNGIGQRNVIDIGITTRSGRYIIEQCTIASDDDDDNNNNNSGDNLDTQNQKWVRRLYFLDGNPNVIQSEVNIIQQQNQQQQSSLSATCVSTEWIIDKSITAFDYHKALTAGLLALLPPLTTHTEEHPSTSIETTVEHSSYTGLLIGLGGGCLINYWHYIHGDDIDSHIDNLKNGTAINTNKKKNPWNVTAVELDPTIVHIASKHFGLSRNHPALNILVGDGLCVHCKDKNDHDDNGNIDIVTQQIKESEFLKTCAKNAESLVERDSRKIDNLGFHRESLDYIVIDVDSKETGAGMSCPPERFVDISYLQTLHELLHPDHGMLAINVAARDIHLFHKTCQAVQYVFPFIFLSKPYPNQDHTTHQEQAAGDEPEDLNVVLFAVKQGTGTSSETNLPVLPHQSIMKDRIRIWTCLVDRNDRDSKSEERTVLLSDISNCTDDFVLYDGDTVTNETTTRNDITSNNNKKRNNKRRGNKKKK